jgi:2-C-methyl-D-erythritol 4-phosphate cytidylyltransferase/2-C-methyl-D-erythritol 2,4-cyclodiphosphate synthase
VKVLAVLLCAGKSERFGQDKITTSLNQKPLWKWSFETFLSHPQIAAVGILTSADKVETLRAQAPEALFVKPGGTSRTESSRIAVENAGDYDILLIHDGARPFVTHEVITRVLEGIEKQGAAAAAVKVTDTIRNTSEPNQNLPRENLVAMQTPQGARVELFQTAYNQFQGEATDDIAVLNAAGFPYLLTEGDIKNKKITHPADMNTTPEFRTGLGYDIHSFSEDLNRPLMLGGVHFPNHPALEGHSDADVLLHAVVDSLLGAAGLGDIGQLFPNTDDSWKNKESTYFLSEAKRLLRQNGWEIVNVDATIIAETPKVMARAQDIKAKIAEILEIQADRVNLKATTNEKLGAIGRKEGIAAFATAMIKRETP